MYHPQSASYRLHAENINSANGNLISSIVITEDELPIGDEIFQRTIIIPEKEVVLGVEALNTHFFDGKLQTSFMDSIEMDAAQSIKEDIIRASNITKEEKSKAFLELEELIQNQTKFPVTSSAFACLRILISTHNSHGRLESPSNQNYSSTDKLHACDLLYLLYEKIVIENNFEYLNLLLSQLNEMYMGLCNQGRVIRLFQTFALLRNDLTLTSGPMIDDNVRQEEI